MVTTICDFSPDSDSLKTLYLALIHPNICYGLLIWGSANQTTLKRTNILHKRAMQLISKAHYNSHSEPIFKRLKILKVCDQYESVYE